MNRERASAKRAEGRAGSSPAYDDLTPGDRLAAIVRSSDDAIYSKDHNATITSWNPAAERMYGYSSAEAIGRDVATIVPSWRRGEERRILELILRGERVEHFETERITKDGRTIEVSITVSPVLDRAGNIVEASIISRDIGDQRRAQEALAKAREAEAAVRTAQEFVAMATHDLVNPVTVIGASAYTLRKEWTELSDRRRGELLTTVERNAERMGRLVADLLTVARAEAHELRPNPRPVKLREFIDELGQEFPDVSINNSGDGLQLDVDPEHLHRIVSNLILNARRYGAAPIEIDVTPGDASVDIVVADHGDGIPASLAPHLFSKFARGDNAAPGGTGLGLAIVRALAEANSGEAWHEAGSPRGTRFGVRFPVRS